MKRTLCFILSTVMIVAGFAACSKNGENASGSTGAASGAQTTVATPSESTPEGPPTTQKPLAPSQTQTTKSKPVQGSTTTKEAKKEKTASDGKKYISITFDDGPGQYTSDLLDGLSKRGVKAAFFMLGSQVSYFPNTTKRIVEEGHMVGSHTYDHKNLAKMSDAQIKKQLDDTDAAIQKAAGVSAEALRPPYGDFTKAKMKKVNKMIVLWNLDPKDWENRNAQTVCNRIVNHAEHGDIILVHDIYKTSVDGALKAIDILQQKGFIFVRPDTLVEKCGGTVKNGFPYYNGFDKAADTPSDTKAA